MDKYEFSMKVDEMKRLVVNEQFRKAYKVLETVDVKKIKNIKDLYIVVDILVENEKYDNAKEILAGISKKIKSRRVFHQLIDISIKCGQADSAKKYMKEFRKIAPKDPYNYVFLYQIAGLLEEGIDQQIRILENLKQYEYIEKWAYELAKAYHRAGRDEDCIAECDDLILWFGEGIYVEKAKLLKQYLNGEVTKEELTSLKAKKATPIHVEQEPESEDTSKAELVQLDQIWKKKGKEQYQGVDTKTSHGTSYQSAFDFIEHMEQKEHEQELDIIMGKQEKEHSKQSSPAKGPSYDPYAPIREESTYNKKKAEAKTDQAPITEVKAEQEAEPDAKAESAPDVKAEPKDQTEAKPQVQIVPEVKVEVKAATERQVKQLVNETSSSIAAQIGAMFEETEEAKKVSEEFETFEKTEEFMQSIESVSKASEESESVEESTECEVIEASESVEKPAECEEIEELESVEKSAGYEVIEESECIEEPEGAEESASSDVSEAAATIESADDAWDNVNDQEPEDEIASMVRKRKQIAMANRYQDLLQKKSINHVSVGDLLGQFTKIQEVSEDILASLENIIDAHNKITLLTQGFHTFDQTYFARKFAKLLYSLELLKSQKIIILGEEKFLQVDFAKHVEQASDSCVVVERITAVSDRLKQQVEALHQLGCVVILEMTEPVEDALTVQMQQLPRNGVIHITEFDAEDLLGFAEDFVREKEYQMEEDARKYILQYAKECLETENNEAFCKVLEKIANAYHCANQRNKVELRNIAESGNYQDAAFMSIRYIDFANEN